MRGALQFIINVRFQAYINNYRESVSSHNKKVIHSGERRSMVDFTHAGRMSRELNVRIAAVIETNRYFMILIHCNFRWHVRSLSLAHS